MKQKVIILRGSSGVGKSSVASLLTKSLRKEVKRLAYLPVDVGYLFMRTHREISREEKGEIMQENIELVLNNFLKRGFTVILDGMFDRKHKNQPSVRRLINIIKKYKVKTFVIELHAHLDILHKRIDERSKKNSNAWNIPKDTEDRYKRFMDSLHKDAIIIETGKKSSKKVANEILKVIK